MYTQVENTYLSQAAQAAGSTAVYDTNVKYLLADKQILARILKYTIQECREVTIEDIMACIGEDIEVVSAALDPGLSNLGRVREDKTEDSGNAHRVELMQGALHQSRQVIQDLLEDPGDIPEDILSAIRQEENVETLRIWYKAAAEAESMDDFRDKLK